MTNQTTPENQIKDLSVLYGKESCLQSISLNIPKNQITGIMGPSNSGKSTLLTDLESFIRSDPQVS